MLELAAAELKGRSDLAKLLNAKAAIRSSGKACHRDMVGQSSL